MSGSGFPSFFLVPGNTVMRQSVLGTSSSDDGLVKKSTNWCMLWVGRIYPNYLTHYALPSHLIWFTAFLEFIPISTKASSTGTPTIVITATNTSGAQDFFLFPVIPYFVRPHIKLTCGRLTTITVLCASIISFVNRTTGKWSAPSFTNSVFSP